MAGTRGPRAAGGCPVSLAGPASSLWAFPALPLPRPSPPQLSFHSRPGLWALGGPGKWEWPQGPQGALGVTGHRRRSWTGSWTTGDLRGCGTPCWVQAPARARSPAAQRPFLPVLPPWTASTRLALPSRGLASGLDPCPRGLPRTPLLPAPRGSLLRREVNVAIEAPWGSSAGPPSTAPLGRRPQARLSVAGLGAWVSAAFTAACVHSRFQNLPGSGHARDVEVTGSTCPCPHGYGKSKGREQLQAGLISAGGPGGVRGHQGRAAAASKLRGGGS